MICDKCTVRQIQESMIADDAFRAHCNGILTTVCLILLFIWPVKPDLFAEMFIGLNLAWHLAGLRRAIIAKRGGGAAT